jgi:type I restriction enzyme R subunit
VATQAIVTILICRFNADCRCGKARKHQCRGKIPQAERYSRGFKQNPNMRPPADEGRTIAWADNEEGHYQVPFVYSCNSRPFVKQLAEQSGTWFRDVRELANLARPLRDFHSPEGFRYT